MEALLHYVRNGSDAEKWGAVNALYHASVAWKPPYGPVQIDAPTCERFGALIGEEMLRQFVQTNDLALLQTIVRWLRPVDAYRRGFATSPAALTKSPATTPMNSSGQWNLGRRAKQDSLFTAAFPEVRQQLSPFGTSAHAAR